MKIVHLSDLHFGRDDAQVTGALTREITALEPDLIIISGDFTQNGTAREFAQAQDFLKALPAPFYAVPGNHDVPTRNLGERFLHPYRKYQRYIAHDIEPVLNTDLACIAGINTARRALPHWNWANGAISPAQCAHLESVFGAARQPWKICVMHHPLHRAEESPLGVTVFGGRKAMRALENSGVHLVLTGHVHHASITVHTYDQVKQTVYLSASTALSTRTRKQGNGFNVITVTADAIHIESVVFQGSIFIPLYSHVIPKNT